MQKKQKKNKKKRMVWQAKKRTESAEEGEEAGEQDSFAFMEAVQAFQRRKRKEKEEQGEGDEADKKISKTMKDFADYLTGEYPVELRFHAGCPDGCFSAVELEKFIKENQTQAQKEKYGDIKIKCIAAFHGTTIADSIEEDCVAFFLDISPTKEDAENLKKAKISIVLDHHNTATDALTFLTSTVPNVYNLSNMSGNECGASLAQKFCECEAIDDWIIQLFHRMDVFEHPLPAELKDLYEPFKGFMLDAGVGKCTMDMVKKFIANPGKALKFGARRYPQIKKYTEEAFHTKVCMVDLLNVQVWAADLEDGYDNNAMDPEAYQNLIDTLNVPVDTTLVFVTLNRTKVVPKDGGQPQWRIGLRRKGESIDVGVLAEQLKEQRAALGIISGGGHRYAAGVQLVDNFKLPVGVFCDAIAVVTIGLIANRKQLGIGDGIHFCPTCTPA